jgi:hypothetical protein
LCEYACVLNSFQLRVSLGFFNPRHDAHHIIRVFEKYDGKDILFLTEKSKRPGKVRQGVAGKMD